MKIISLLFLIAALLFPVNLFSHELPVTPVKIVLKLDPQVIRVHMEANGYFWNNEILRDKYDPDRWPENIRERAKTYVDNHFVLRAGGQILPSQLVSCKTVEEPWNRYWEVKVLLDLAYPAPAGAGNLSGKAVFYEEEWKEHLGRHNESVPRQFWTILKIPGAKKTTLLLPLDKPDFEVPIEDARRTPGQMRWESFLLGIKKTLIFPPFILFIFSMVLFWRREIFLWTLFPGVLIAGYLIPGFMSNYAEKLSWILLSLVSAVILLNPEVRFFLILSSGSAFFWGQIFECISGSIVSSFKFLSLSGAFFIAGSILAGVVLSGFFYLIVTYYRRHLKALSETMWGEIFVSRRRLTVITLLVLGLYNIFQTG